MYSVTKPVTLQMQKARDRSRSVLEVPLRTQQPERPRPRQYQERA